MQVAATISSQGNCSCRLQRQFPRREIAHAGCSDNFLAGKLPMQVAATISSQGNCPCKLQRQFPRREIAHASCSDNFLAGKLLMHGAATTHQGFRIRRNFWFLLAACLCECLLLSCLGDAVKYLKASRFWFYFFYFFKKKYLIFAKAKKNNSKCSINLRK
jgi:hypothetical protein